ncbi:ribonuclease domain-containing protein [Isobaculum melis]|uniref:Ribonuclease n=1 Tax=Isobaculum melis TaxID=142588 RepID=A0A1H9U302_9LACT|nr:ribonuclease domain-containing protein [Isobaculum melis]SES03692.1 ribonuclease [Isobaculum melis]
MKRDLQINFGVIDDICTKLYKYRDSLEQARYSIESIQNNISTHNSGKGVKALETNKIVLVKQIDEQQEEVRDLFNLFSQYKEEMNRHIQPLQLHGMTRVSRNDIYWNLFTLEDKHNLNIKSLTIDKFEIDWGGLITLDKDEADKERYNARQMDDIKTSCMPSYQRKLNELIDCMKAIHENHVIPYEDIDDDFASQARKLQDKYGSRDEKKAYISKKVKNAPIKTLDGASEWFTKTVTSTAESGVNLTGSVTDVILAKRFGYQPHPFSTQTVDGTVNGLKMIYNNPFVIIEGIAQDTSDIYEHKGPEYLIGVLGIQAYLAWSINKLNQPSKFEKASKPSTGNGSNSPKNVGLHEKYKDVLRTTEKANPLVDSLGETGKLPDNFISKDLAIENGWRPGKALENYVPGGQIGGDIYQNSTKLLPEVPGRVWREADVGLIGDLSRAKQPGTRLLYSNDGLLYITTDHYKTMHFIGNY